MDANTIFKRIDTVFTGIMLVLLVFLIMVMTENANGQQISYEVIYPSCADCNDGVIDFTINDTMMQAEFTWADGSTFEDKSGLAVGSYNVHIRNSLTGELYFYSIDVDHQSQPTIEIFTQDVTCFGYDNGLIMINAKNTSGEVTVSINDDDPLKKTSFEHLKGGEYLVRVFDRNGMIEERSVMISEPNPIEIDINIAYLACLTNSAQIDADISGGSGSYNANWNDGVSGASRYHTAPGEYILTVTDENFCVSTDHVSIPYHTGDMHIRSTSVGESEPGREDGVIDIDINGGQKPLSFFWSNGYRGEDLYFVGSGIYSVRVQDGAGCEVVMPVEVPEASAKSVVSGLSN